MSRQKRADVFDPSEMATVHVMNRVVRRCLLMGSDQFSGKNYDYRKNWIEEELERVAACMGIDLLNFAILSNHFHLILRSRPDVVKKWDDSEVVRRWLKVCPNCQCKGRPPGPATEPQIKAICGDKKLVNQLRRRLSDISWWMRLVCQRIAQWANSEDKESGKFWQSRYRAVRLLDEEAILAGAAYVDLNPIRAAIAETLEGSEHTSLKRRIEALRMNLAESAQPAAAEQSLEPSASQPRDAFLAPLEIDQLQDELGPRPHTGGQRCSDKGFLAMTLGAYLALLDWTARQLVPGKTGATPEETPAVFERLQIKPDVWCQLVSQFGQLFSSIAGKPQVVDSHCSAKGQRTPLHLPKATRELLSR